MKNEVDNDPSKAPSRRFSLWLYLLIVFGLSWPFQIVSAVWARSVLATTLLNSASMVMVTVGTYLAGKYVFRDGFAGAGWRWGRWKSHLAVLGLAAVLWIAPTLIDLAAGTLDVPTDLNRVKFGWVLLLPLLYLVPAFGEEFGWRGYMLPRLAQRVAPREAVVIHGIIWWAWHIPVLAGTGFQVGAAMTDETGLLGRASGMALAVAVVFVSAIPAVLHGVVVAFIWTRSGSLAVATVYHAAFDGFRDSLSILIGLGPLAVGFENMMLITLGFIFLWKGNWRLNQTGAPNPTRAP
jgi:membrane protease YdiL (CAAX protease family)